MSLTTHEMHAPITQPLLRLNTDERHFVHVTLRDLFTKHGANHGRLALLLRFAADQYEGKERRARLFVIGDVLVKQNKDGPFRAAYDRRKDYERERAKARGLTVAPSAKIPAKRAAEFMSDGHVHRRAQRYMETRFLMALWKAWKREHGAVPHPVKQAA